MKGKSGAGLVLAGLFLLNAGVWMVLAGRKCRKRNGHEEA